VLPEQIAELQKNRKEHTHLTVYAPIGGTIIEKSIREGMYVQEGDALYRIAELDPIWLYLDIYESDLGWIRYGQRVAVTVEAFPGETFEGVIVFIEPFLDDRTRTVKVRVNLKNKDRRLKPAMYASATIRVRLQADGLPEPTGIEGKYICPMHPEIVADAPGRCSICDMALEPVPNQPKPKSPPLAQSSEPTPLGKVLAVRSSAVLDTGRRQIAYRQTKDGAFELVDVQLGPRAESDQEGQSIGYYPLLGGLRAGDRVVIRGGFMLDSQRQIEGMPSLLYAQGQSAANLHAGHGGQPVPSSGKPASGGAGHQH
jgi:Cu(I)/Ag(I) efflux system membrane fusion protein